MYFMFNIRTCQRGVIIHLNEILGGVMDTGFLANGVTMKNGVTQNSHSGNTLHHALMIAILLLRNGRMCIPSYIKRLKLSRGEITD